MSAQDFDFLHGSWRIAHRCLAERLAGCEEWTTFADGLGIFLGPDTHDGVPVVCRFTWSDITPDSVRWAQALSPDDGVTRGTNWIMELSRIEVEA